MNPQNSRAWNRMFRFCLPLIVAGLLLPVGSIRAEASDEELSWELKMELLAPVQSWVAKNTKDRNADGVNHRKGIASKLPRKVDDETFEVTVHIATAESNHVLTERYLLVVKKSGGGWEVAEAEVVDSRVSLYRETGGGCFPFEQFSFDREGLKMSAKGGKMCEWYLEGRISGFALRADDMSYSYTVPKNVSLAQQTGHDFYALQKLMLKDHSADLVFPPAGIFFDCDIDTCDRLIEESFDGLDHANPEKRVEFTYETDDPNLPGWARRLMDDEYKGRRSNAFKGFRTLDWPGNVRYQVFISRDLKDIDSGLFMTFNNWAGWEITVGVVPKRRDMPNQLQGRIFGYYSEETLKNSLPYEIERREGLQERWFEVFSVKGEVDLGLDDPEIIEGDLEFGLTIKQEVEELPFFIISFSDRNLTGGDKAAPLSVNSVQMDGEELTWVRTSPLSGRVILPEKVPAGTRIKLRMIFATRAMKKYTHSFSAMNRQGWMPFVRFGDIIDEFELTIRSPADYQILGVGHRESETVEGDVRISHWKAESPVNFPTIIMGKYRSDMAKFDAYKKDGKTVIPVRVSVDEASFMNFGIRGTELREVAEQAANSINLYTQVSGLEYPFGELNLVNDARGGLYGQAPSSIIYLGSAVFMGEAELLKNPFLTNPSRISKFKRSVIPHEVGHQWWGNTIANANDRNYWFVESLAEYFSALYIEQAFGWNAYVDKVNEWRGNILNSNLKANVQNASTLFAGERGGGRGETDGYTAAVYNKGPYAFHMLRETFKDPTIEERGPLGADARFFTFLKLFCRELAEKREIVSLDIQHAAESGLGGTDQDGNRVNVDLSWFFDQWIRGSGIPQYTFKYDVRRAEDGGYVVDGVIKQRVVIGSGKDLTTLEDRLYRGIVYVSAKAKGAAYKHRVIINAVETPFQFKVAKKPFDVVLNDDGEMLALDVATQ